MLPDVVASWRCAAFVFSGVSALKLQDSVLTFNEDVLFLCCRASVLWDLCRFLPLCVPWRGRRTSAQEGEDSGGHVRGRGRRIVGHVLRRPLAHLSWDTEKHAYIHTHTHTYTLGLSESVYVCLCLRPLFRWVRVGPAQRPPWWSP